MGRIKKNKIIFSILAFMIVLLITIYLIQYITSKKYETISLNLKVEDTHILNTKECINPKYNVSNQEVLSIDTNGKIIAHQVGNSNIIVKNTDDSICLVYNISISEKENEIIPEEEKISITNIITSKEIKIKENEVKKLDITIKPENHTEKLLFSVTNESIATISSDGTIKGLKEGKTEVVINTSENSITKYITIIVEKNNQDNNNNNNNDNNNDNDNNNNDNNNNDNNNNDNNPNNNSNNISELDKIKVEYDDLISFETKGSKDVYPVIDLLVATNSRIKGKIAKIDEIIRNLKNLGFTKIYFVTLPNNIPSIGWGLNKAVPDGISYQYWESAMRNTSNNINKAFADSCHKYGMEAIAIYKPYENGGGTSYPSGKTTLYASFLKNKTAVSTIGGMRSYFSTLVSNHPEYRLKRKYNETEIENSKLAINKVEMSFYNDSVKLSNISLSTLNNKQENKPTLWISTDNGEYFVYEDFTYQYTYSSSYKIKDANNFSTNYNKPVITLTLNINNLAPKYRYVAVSFSSNHYFQKNQSALNNGYATFPHSMIKLYNDKTEIPTSVAYFVRTVNNQNDTVSSHKWGDEGTPVNANILKGIDVTSYTASGKVTAIDYTLKTNQKNNYSQNFYKWGFEFQYKNSNVSITMGLNSPVYGIAAGKDEYVQSLVCEGYDEVRSYWLNEVKELLNYYDGIDIRTTTHSGNVIDYAYYGYNEPISKRYYEKYKVKLENEPVNYVVTRRISEIRGEFFLKFLNSASSYAKSKNKELATDFYVTSYETYDYQDVTTYKPLLEGINQFYYWFNSKMIIQYWKNAIDISNYIVYKDIFTPSYNSTNSKIGTNFLNYAHLKNKEVLIHCYTTQGNSNCPKSFFDEVDNTLIDGVLVYEIVPWTNYDSLISNLISVRKTSPSYTINSNTITGVKNNTKVSDFVKNLNMAGTFVVLDYNGNSISKNSYIKDNMTLVMNDKYKYIIKIN